jgi:uncharacterized membrane protein HdeD (DUF308 family)
MSTIAQGPTGFGGFRDPLDEYAEDVERAYASSWWLFLIAGILWLLLGFMILSLRPSSVSITVILIAFAFWLGAFTMFLAGTVTRGGWRVLAIVGGILAIAAGIAAIAWPEPTLVVLGVFVAWYLLFRGIFDIVMALSHTHVKGWWLGLVGGIIEIALGAWAVGHPDRSVLLIVTIVGVWAIFRGVMDLVAGFRLRDLKRSLA